MEAAAASLPETAAPYKDPRLSYFLMCFETVKALCCSSCSFLVARPLYTSPYPKSTPSLESDRRNHINCC